MFFCRTQPSRGSQDQMNVIILTMPCKGCTAPDPQRPRCSLSRCTGCELPHPTASANGQSHALADLPVSSPGDPASHGAPAVLHGVVPTVLTYASLLERTACHALLMKKILCFLHVCRSLTCTPQAGRAQRTRWETPSGHFASKPSMGKPPGLHTAYLDPREHGLGVSTTQMPQGQRTTDNCARSCLQEHPLPPMSPGRGVLLGVQTQGQPPQYV